MVGATLGGRTATADMPLTLAAPPPTRICPVGTDAALVPPPTVPVAEDLIGVASVATTNTANAAEAEMATTAASEEAARIKTKLDEMQKALTLDEKALAEKKNEIARLEAQLGSA